MLKLLFLSAALLSAVTVSAAVNGRYVRVFIPHTQATLSLAEVQVFSGGENVALKKPSRQSSTDAGGVAARAVDGNTSGEWGDGSVTHTSHWKSCPAWEVDLGGECVIDKIVIWNRNLVPMRLDGFYVVVLDAAHTVLWGATQAQAGTAAMTFDTGTPSAPGVVGKVAPELTDSHRIVEVLDKKNVDVLPPAAAQPAAKVRTVYEDLDEQTGGISLEAMQRLIDWLCRRHPARKAEWTDALAQLGACDIDAVRERLKRSDESAVAEAQRILALQRAIVMSNPVLDFSEILLLRRELKGKNMGLPSNWESNSSVNGRGWNNELCSLAIKEPQAELKTIFRPGDEYGQGMITDVDLHFDAQRLMFSMPDKSGRFQIFEMNVDGTALTHLPLIPDEFVENYDSCYLPDGNIVFTSTATMIGVPCVGGQSKVTNMYLWHAADKSIRRLTFDQEHNWCPVVTQNGMVMFLRWEYSDLPHYVARILMTMNPDGSNQRGYYGSNSYWPNCIFYARPIPDNSGRFVGIVSGHHGVKRVGELVLFDPQKGRFEADGVVQRIPGYGKTVEPVILDHLVDNSWPKFLHPFPLDDTFFLVSAQMSAAGNMGIYLADVFDNLVLLKEVPGHALLEPLPLKAVQRPPVIPPKVDPGSANAVMFINDLYHGPGLQGVPRGTVKKLRLVTYHFGYRNMGSQGSRIGLDGPWDIKRVLGTVDVEEDGSAIFTVPANTPISIQPLDAEGKAIQLMRSWATAMPGEVLSCVGCHESPDDAPPARVCMAAHKAPQNIIPWYGPMRGFSFNREVQPVLDASCVKCHDGKEPGRPDFSRRPDVIVGNGGTHFSPAYVALMSFVRSHTMESDMHLLNPYEYHAETTELVKMLRAGHKGLRLDPESLDRIYTWIDLNAPYHGTWAENVGAAKVGEQRAQRIDLLQRYAGVTDDEEAILETVLGIRSAEPDTSVKEKAPVPAWGFADAEERQAALGTVFEDMVLDGRVKLRLVAIPSGSFYDSSSEKMVAVEKPFKMSAFEITNELYALFDPEHDSRLESGDFLQFSIRERGYFVNRPEQPVCRVSWDDAQKFCEWLSEKSGRRFTLPSAAQWEWACRAGAQTPMWYGSVTNRFDAYENLADINLVTVEKLGWGLPAGAVPEWRPGDKSQNDGHRVSAPVGSYKPNPWGLYDMHGNVAEWVDSEYDRARKLVKGGSWYDRPSHSTASQRTGYFPWQGVYNVGFRVIQQDGTGATNSD